VEINIFIRNFKLTTKLKEKHEINERFKMIQLHTDKKKKKKKEEGMGAGAGAGDSIKSISIKTFSISFIFFKCSQVLKFCIM